MMSTGIAGELSEGNKEYAEIIHQSGQHLLDIVNMLLDMSKIEAGKFELQTEAVSPESLIAPSVSIVDSLARSRNVTLRTELAPSLPQVVCDERACRQILINLLSNAIKFSHEGGEVTVRMKQQGQYLSIAIIDHGIGMPNEVLDRIGEPFFQAQAGLSRHYEGTGLGLSIVKGLIDLHDGTLHAQSAAGHGTTMYVLLPINGPATKFVQSDVVTQLVREETSKPLPTWQDPKSIAL
jgi:cell cycle sensor histidine kinase DivJ